MWCTGVLESGFHCLKKRKRGKNMYLEDLSKIIYTKGTASEDTHITIKACADAKICKEGKILWEGKAKDLKHHQGIYGWTVVEILVDRSCEEEKDLPDYNKGKIIMVI